MRLLDYFGEASGPCGNCDTCLAPPETFDASTLAQKALSTIYRTGQRFGAVHLIDVLRGKGGERIARWGHERLSVFGIGADVDEATWRNVFRQLVALGFAAVDHEGHGALKLTDAARGVLRGETPVAMRRNVAKPKGARVKAIVTPDGPLDAAAHERLARLRAWRLDEARTQGVPAYVIFHDRTLAEIARVAPADRDALATISGVGTAKLARYGERIVALVTGDTRAAHE